MPEAHFKIGLYAQTLVHHNYRGQMQEMQDRGSAAEVLADVLCKVLQQLQHRNSVAEELVQTLDRVRSHEKETGTCHAHVIR